MIKNKFYRIAWKVKNNDEINYGSWYTSGYKTHLLSQCDELNSIYPMLNHWLEETNTLFSLEDINSGKYLLKPAIRVIS